MKKITLVVFLSLFSILAHAAACTGYVKLQKFYPNEAGYIHILAEGVADMDVMNCGIHSDAGMLLNFSDSSGTEMGKKVLYTTLLTAYTTGKIINLCSSGCDSVHTRYSRLSYIYTQD